MDDGFVVEVFEVGQDSLFQFGLGCHPDMTEQRPRHLGEEAFDKIEPRAMLRREHKAEATLWLGRQPSLRLLRNVRGMIVEDQFDGGLSGIGGVEPLEEADELARAMTILDTGMHLARQQVDPGEQTECAMALVFMVTGEALMRPGFGAKSGAVLPTACSPGFSS